MVTTESDAGATTYKIPSHADFLIAYRWGAWRRDRDLSPRSFINPMTSISSTVPGFYSWRNTTQGSWFIQVQLLAMSYSSSGSIGLYLFIPGILSRHPEGGSQQRPSFNPHKVIMDRDLSPMSLIVNIVCVPGWQGRSRSTSSPTCRLTSGCTRRSRSRAWRACWPGTSSSPGSDQWTKPVNQCIIILRDTRLAFLLDWSRILVLNYQANIGLSIILSTSYLYVVIILSTFRNTDN